MGTETPKNIELTYDSINFINYPVKEKNELMQTLQNFITHLWDVQFLFSFSQFNGSFYPAIKKSVGSTSNKLSLANISFCLTCKLRHPKGESIRDVLGAGVAEAFIPWICSKANPSISLPCVDEKLNYFV